MRSVKLACTATVLLLLLGAPSRAEAFAVECHQALTGAALDTARGSKARALLQAHRGAVVHGATAEDLNLHVKWTGWHHFYFPEGSLDTAIRRASDARVRELWEEAMEAARHGDLERAFDRAGHLAHHVQDMASPPHVVPVNHGLTDRFERYGVRTSLARAPVRDVAPLPGDEAQRALARETLAAVRTESVSTPHGPIPWSAFWAEPERHDAGTFGHYGAEAGNAFGANTVHWHGRRYRIAPADYSAFMDARVSSAVAYTRAFLEWASERFAEAASAEPVALRGFRPAPELSLQVLGGVTRDSRGTTPTLGLRAALPLPRSLKLSVDWTRRVGGAGASSGAGGGSLSVLSPPLWAARPGYPLGLDLRACVGVGLFPWEGQRRVGLPLGLRANASLGRPFTVSAEVLYQGLKPPDAAWAHGVAFTLGMGLAWGDR
ncbi:phospholipase C/P1 nuclease family protein [Hyalangium gracile]|uniref:hypothetical protein n=1 Tax=Hyalangium gracile TaxID=394092 RepID=UPI001CCBE6F0|nr:hypothetical protein [Hyalangium gracile]